jgi:flavin-binding protein dodecin
MAERAARPFLRDRACPTGEISMTDHVYKSLELTGSSDKGFQEAIQRAVSKAHQTIRNIRWFEVLDMRGHVSDGQVAHWQVTVKIGFTLEDNP